MDGPAKSLVLERLSRFGIGLNGEFLSGEIVDPSRLAEIYNDFRHRMRLTQTPLLNPRDVDWVDQHYQILNSPPTDILGQALYCATNSEAKVFLIPVIKEIVAEALRDKLQVSPLERAIDHAYWILISSMPIAVNSNSELSDLDDEFVRLILAVSKVGPDTGLTPELLSEAALDAFSYIYCQLVFKMLFGRSLFKRQRLILTQLSLRPNSRAIHFYPDDSIAYFSDSEVKEIDGLKEADEFSDLLFYPALIFI